MIVVSSYLPCGHLGKTFVSDAFLLVDIELIAVAVAVVVNEIIKITCTKRRETRKYGLGNGFNEGKY